MVKKILLLIVLCLTACTTVRYIERPRCVDATYEGLQQYLLDTEIFFKVVEIYQQSGVKYVILFKGGKNEISDKK